MNALTTAQFKSFDDRTALIELPHVGNDVLAFLHVIHLARLDEYDHFLKMHSMGIRFDHQKLLGANLYAYGWRNTLVETLLESEAALRRHLAELDGNRETGMIASTLLLSPSMREASEDKNHFVETWVQTMKLNPKLDPAPIVAGRMFLMRTALCLPLRSLDLPGIEREFNEGRLTAETLEHAWEKLFALLLDHGNATVLNAGNPITVENPRTVTERTGVMALPKSRLRLYLHLGYLKIGKWARIYDNDQYRLMKLAVRKMIKSSNRNPGC